jgi:hypothetical protein
MFECLAVTRIRSLILLTCPLVAGGCVTSGPNGEDAGLPYSIHCEPRPELHSSDFKVVRCQFQSRAADPLDVHVTKVTFTPGDLNDRIADPGAIATYHEQLVKSDGDTEKTSLIAGLVVGTAAVLGGGRGGSGPAAGMVVAGGAALSASKSTDFAAGHLLGPAFTLAPGKTESKLLLVKTPENTVRPEAMTVCLDKPANRCVDLNFGPTSRARVGSW